MTYCKLYAAAAVHVNIGKSILTDTLEGHFTPLSPFNEKKAHNTSFLDLYASYTMWTCEAFFFGSLFGGNRPSTKILKYIWPTLTI